MISGIRAPRKTDQHAIELRVEVARFSSYRVVMPVFFFALSLVSSCAGATSRIQLRDGTQLVGDLVSVSEDRYLIRSEVLGEIELSESSIRSIQPTAASDRDDAFGAAVPLQQQGLRSADLPQLLMTLRSNPALQSAISDPELMQLVMSGSLGALQQDPRVLRMLADPKVQAVVSSLLSQ